MRRAGVAPHPGQVRIVPGPYLFYKLVYGNYASYNTFDFCLMMLTCPLPFMLNSYWRAATPPPRHPGHPAPTPQRQPGPTLAPQVLPADRRPHRLPRGGTQGCGRTKGR